MQMHFIHFKCTQLYNIRMFCRKAVVNKIFRNTNFTRRLMDDFLLQGSAVATDGTPQKRQGNSLLYQSKRLFLSILCVTIL